MMGMVGLLIGVPLLAILISVFRDLDAYITSVRKLYSIARKKEEIEAFEE